MRAERESSSARRRNSGCRVTENLFFGEIPAIVIENDRLRLTILVGRGADVVECLYKRKDLDLVWLTQWGIPTKQVPANYPPNVDSFLDGYPGGWQSIFPNGGAPSTVDGVEFAQHDEIALLPWDHEVIEESSEMVAVRCTVLTRKTKFRISKTFTLKAGTSTVSVQEEIENLADSPQHAMWGFHISFGAPFLNQESVIELPNDVEVIPHPEAITSTGRRVASTDRFTWPIATSSDGGKVDFSKMPEKGTDSEMLYLIGFETGWYRITSPSSDISVRVSWDKDLLPYLWYWQEFGSSTEYPWFGKHYNIGLEPFSSFPTNGLAEAIKNGSALTFQAGEKKVSEIEFEVSER